MSSHSSPAHSRFVNGSGRIAVLNRGEPTVRLLRAVREYNVERGTRYECVAMYTQPDAAAPWVRQADDTIALGEPMRVRPDGGMVSAYCDIPFVLQAVRDHGCDALWPGWGFASEDAELAHELSAAGIVFMGPPARAMRALGDKLASRSLAAACDVPLARWRPVDPDHTPDMIERAARDVGYPLMVKAAGGGGGRGIRRVTDVSGLMDALAQVRAEVARSFGGGGVFMEACIEGGRHIEVQFAVGADGRGVAVGVRDCTIQRRNQKVIEESHSPVLPSIINTDLREATVRLAEASGYRGVGTAEFLYTPSTGDAYFLEVNARLQVEHTVTELVTGCDLVKTQIDIARELPWDPGMLAERGWAIQARVNAEDPAQGFRPSPGRVIHFHPPSGPGIRVDTALSTGMTIPPDFDSNIAKVIAWGATRREAIARLERAIGELEIIVEDGATNKAFLLQILRAEEFLRARADTRWLDRSARLLEGLDAQSAEAAFYVASIIAHRQERQAEIARFFAEVRNGVPQHLAAPTGVPLDLRMDGVTRSTVAYQLSPEDYAIRVGHALRFVRLQPMGRNAAMLYLPSPDSDHAPTRHRVLYAVGPNSMSIEIDGVQHRAERASGGVVRAPAPAMVAQVAVEDGDMVEVGDLLLTLEAMKMETPLTAEHAGMVEAVMCRANQQVVSGQPLLVIRPLAADGSSATSAEDPTSDPEGSELGWRDDIASFFRDVDGPCASAASERLKPLLQWWNAAMIGYELPAELHTWLMDVLGDEARFAGLTHPERWSGLYDALRVFADCQAVFDKTLLVLHDEPVALSPHTAFHDYCRRHGTGPEGVRDQMQGILEAALATHDVRSLHPEPGTREALWRLAVAHNANAPRHRLCSAALRALVTLGPLSVTAEHGAKMLERVAAKADDAHPYVADNARQALYILVQRPSYEARRATLAQAISTLGHPDLHPDLERLVVASNEPVLRPLLEGLRTPTLGLTAAILRRLYAPDVPNSRSLRPSGALVVGALDFADREVRVVAGRPDDVARELEAQAGELLKRPSAAHELSLDVLLAGDVPSAEIDRVIACLRAAVGDAVRAYTTITVSAGKGANEIAHRCIVGATPCEDVHPSVARRLRLEALEAFTLEPIESGELVHAFRVRARDVKDDERIIAFVEVFDSPDAIGPEGDATLEGMERAYLEGLRVVRGVQGQLDPRARYHWNRLVLLVHGTPQITPSDLGRLARSFESPTRGLGLEAVSIVVGTESGAYREYRVTRPTRNRLEVEIRAYAAEPVAPVTPYDRRVVRSRRLGYAYPYEVLRMLEGRSRGAGPHVDIQHGSFIEHDLDDDGALVPVERPHGGNTCGVVVGVIRNQTRKHPEGMTRVWIGSDPSFSMGALSEPECRRVIAAIDLAAELDVPVEWVPVSAGAKIAMDSGTENLDWTAAVLRRIVTFCAGGGTIHVIVAGVNVGAQSYWNAEATMLIHTRGALIMTPNGSMVLTGKKALEVSGGVSAEDERAIGGFERVMGPNGQAQYYASDLGDAYNILFEIYRHTYVAPGESAPRRFETNDPSCRSILPFPYTSADGAFTCVGDVFDERHNPGRRKPFSIRAVMQAVIDQDAGHIERFRTMRGAEMAVVWDSHIGGHAVCVIGFESQPKPRQGWVPLDGPETWTGGTLFPRGSKKVARAIRSASGNRPVVLIANLSGFDGSPESLRRLQLEHGAEIGRAVVEFDGLITFVVIGRYHGGAYVVFSKALNEGLISIAVEGAYASVIGGAPAAAVVFPREVRARAEQDPRVRGAREAITKGAESARARLREAYEATLADVILEKQGDVAREFDTIHTVGRAIEVGSLDRVIGAASLRPTLCAYLDEARSSGHS